MMTKATAIGTTLKSGALLAVALAFASCDRTSAPVSTQLRGMDRARQLQLAALLFNQDHGQLPTSLDELHPEYLDKESAFSFGTTHGERQIIHFLLEAI